jgi:hypothetical protein
VRTGLNNFYKNQPKERKFRKDTIYSGNAVPITKDDADRGSW